MEKESKLKVLNLYAGIGGNRKLWTNVDVTAIEYDEKIASIYQDNFPDDRVIVTDAHQYLLENFDKFDFIWSSPPCPSHSRFRLLWKSDGKDTNKYTGKSMKFPDMKLYEEIIFLDHFFNGLFCVENVISYYKPLIQPYEINNHYYWSNFTIKPLPKKSRGIRHGTENNIESGNYFDLDKYNLGIILL